MRDRAVDSHAACDACTRKPGIARLRRQPASGRIGGAELGNSVIAVDDLVGMRFQETGDARFFERLDRHRKPAPEIGEDKVLENVRTVIEIMQEHDYRPREPLGQVRIRISVG